MGIKASTVPQTKAVYPWFTNDGTITFHITGKTLEIADPSNDITELLTLCDGTRNVDALWEDWSTRARTEVHREDLEQILEALNTAKVLEDAHPAKGAEYDSYRTERWSRDLGFFESFATLERSKYDLHASMQDARVALLGLGGVGSHVFMDLLGLGVRDIKAVDFDTVGLSNLNRQILYAEPDLGRTKRECAAEWAAAFNPAAHVEIFQVRFSSPESIFDIVADRDVVISAVDTPKMHISRWVNEACVQAKVPFITGGVEIQRSFIYTVIPGVTGCVECWRSQALHSDDERVHQQISQRDEQAHARHERYGSDLAAYGPLVTQHAGCVITELTRLMTGIAPPAAAGRLVAMGIQQLQTEVIESWDRMPDCAVCGNGPW